MPERILIVETELDLAGLMQRDLEAAGYQVDAVARDIEAELSLRDHVPDLIVLGAVPSETAYSLCELVRAYAGRVRVPIITVVCQDVDGLRGLDAGADNFVVKPICAAHLLARVRALLRRAKPNDAGRVLRIADVKLDRDCHRAIRANREVHLGPTEFRLLEFLMRNPGQVFSREQLLKAVWGPKANVEVRTVDVHIGRLRAALNIGNRPDLVRTVRGAGYGFKEKPDSYGASPFATSDLEGHHVRE